MIPAAVGVALVLAGTAALALYDHDGSYDWRRIRRSQLLLWGFAGVVCAYVLVVEGQTLASLDPADGGLPAVLTVAWAWILVAGTAVVTALLFKFAGREAYDPVFESLVDLPLHRTLFVAVGAGVTEEVVFRGYLLTRVLELSGSEAIAVVVSGVAFAVAHAATRSRTRLLQLVPMGLAFGVAFQYTGSLLAVVTVHASYDALVLTTTDPEDLPDDALTDA